MYIHWEELAVSNTTIGEEREIYSKEFRKLQERRKSKSNKGPKLVKKKGERLKIIFPKMFTNNIQ